MTPSTLVMPDDTEEMLERSRYRGASVAWDDVIGHEPAKRELRIVAEQLRRHTIARELGLPMIRGVLLMGPSGSGKTMLSRALATAIDRPVHVLPSAELDAKRIRRIYEALATTPSLIVLDEADVILRSRNRPGALGEGTVAAALCAAIDSADPVLGPVTLALTAEDEWGLDPSLLRSGRLTTKVILRKPGLDERRRLFALYTERLPRVGELDLQLAAERSIGATGADIQAAVNTALAMSFIDGTDALVMAFLDEAIMRQGHVEERQASPSERELSMRAVHEAGHAVMAVRLWGPDAVSTVTLMASRASDARTLLADHLREEGQKTVGLLRGLVRFAYAGMVAEELLAGDDGDISTGGGSDIEMATRVLVRLHGALGESPEVGWLDLDTLEGFGDAGRGSQLMRKTLYHALWHESDDAVADVHAELREQTAAIRSFADILLATPSHTLSGAALHTALEQAMSCG